MSRATMIIRSLWREPEGPKDRLTFSPGVNVLTGAPNTGKSQWLQMLDYLLGDGGGADSAFDEDLVQKYDSILAEVEIRGETYRLARYWKARGQKGKVQVDETPMTVSDFTTWLLDRLAIPALNYPQGNPYSGRTWPTLAWRSLYRHVYRSQKSWGGLAPKQPASEQHACLLQFLGIAEHVFTEDYGSLVQKQREVEKKQHERESYMELLNRISREIFEAATVGVGEDTISRQLATLNARRQELEQRRESLLSSASEALDDEESANLSSLGEHLVALRSEKEGRDTEVANIETQISDLERFAEALEVEKDRLLRARDAGVILSPLRISHCPACQQAVRQPDSPNTDCWLCHQNLPPPAGGTPDSEERFEFELSQLQSEAEEVKELLADLRRDLDSTQRKSRELAEEIFFVEGQIRPTRIAATAILPQEAFAVERELGQIDQREQQWLRMRRTLAYRDELAAKIGELEEEIATLDAAVKEAGKAVSYEQAEDALADGMNEYLNLLKQVRPDAWSQAEVSVDLRKKAFQFRVGKKRWTKLGGTLSLYFLIAYGFSLLRLSGEDHHHHPGLLVLDLPPTLDDGTEAADYERFAAEPFLVESTMADASRSSEGDGQMEEVSKGEPVSPTPEGPPPRQVIFAGRAFSGLTNANIIELDHVWPI